MWWQFWRRRRREAELDEEIAHDLWLETTDRIRTGLSAEDAEYASRKDFGNVLLIKEMTREAWTWRAFEVLVQDMRYAIRGLQHSPAFATASVLTLALGLGVNSAIFTIFDQVAFRPLPIKDGDRVVGIYETFHGTFDRKMHGNIHMLSYDEFRNYESRNHVFGEIAGYAAVRRLTLEGSQPESASGVLVTEQYFKVLGATTTLGRTFLSDELSGPQAVTVLSHGFWQRRFGADPGIVGKTIRLNRSVFTIVGVTAPGFVGTTPSLPDLWLPLSVQPVIMADLPPGEPQNFLTAENLGWLSVIGKLRLGENAQRAQTDLQLIASQLDVSYPGRHTEVSVLLSTFLTNPDARPVILIGGSLVMVAVGLVLFVACANVANLLLARAAGRQREMAVRLAIGASRARLLRQLLTESFLLAVTGGGAGLLLAYKVLELGRTVLKVENVDLRPDFNVVAYTALLSVAASLLFGLAPAIQATSPQLSAALKDDGAFVGSRGRKGSLRSRLISIQIAICCMFLIAAGLLVRGLLNLNRVDPGYQIQNVLLTSVDFQGQDHGEARGATRYRQLLAEIDAEPKTESALATLAPLNSVSMTGVARAEGDPSGPLREVLFNHVSSNYFQVLGIRLSQGRTFTESEVDREAPVAVISEAMRRTYWNRENVIGQRFQFGPTGRMQTAEVIGVASDVRGSHIAALDGPAFYLPVRPTDTPIVITRSDSAGTLVPIIQRLVHEHDPSVLVSVRNLEDNLRNETEPTRIAAASAFLLAALALALAAVGVYGVTAYLATQRTHDVGIRLALGAERSDVLRWIVWQALRPVCLGVLVGMPLAAIGSVAASKLLLGVHPLDPVAFLAVPTFLFLVASLAAYMPGRRATLVDPVAVLRHE